MNTAALDELWETEEKGSVNVSVCALKTNLLKQHENIAAQQKLSVLELHVIKAGNLERFIFRQILVSL